jgi:lysophospholipase L1-like esterase
MDSTRGLWLFMGVFGGWVVATVLSGVAAAGLNLRDKRVLLIGSSSAVGIGSRLEKMLQGHGIAAFKNIGVSGTHLSQWSDNDYEVGRALESALLEYRPDVVFIFVGTNDESLRRSNPNRDIAALRGAAVARLHRKLSNTRSLFIGLPQHHLWPMDQGFRNLLARTWGADYFNTEAIAPEKSSDGIHLSSAGYQTVITGLDRWLRSKA